ncbi:phospho-N-acetylmuramoyl-pentapeptide-transferase [Candidatus Cryosericum odellii]|jgi:phospho-N-acetylmuramoyl-pentapeptide-transferase|uniref:Phospho-N-acetylmuramoyl-pentapeptide-transferase n=1 Tax=Candidatus Cryosericum odellii TaxID=2290917 RepID=A0A398DF03_9BACT|nr:phospho-N-acetylmuramoyl-pentapeptide-transferase [Candidatus Cryosericum odellii]RIE08066.1 phospho-N-acetylmuramoyl-pentapeptide-transferase [Candidatus Cryosericum odellii]RIE10878.1 phospho-N-acetylmuramoyl-pentapeptide-transferase [Candidatus Cryosericum odellii]
MTAKSAMLLVLVLVLVDLALFPLLIVWLRRIRFMQLIRDEGPASHKSKAGTPTGGGLMLFLDIAGAVAAYLFVMGRTSWTRLDVATVVFVAVSFLSGFLDDWTKEVKHRNDGLRGYQKLLIQTAAAGLFFYLAHPLIIPVLHLASGAILLGGWAFYAVAMLYAVGMVNAFNLTDGLDGLLAKTSLPTFAVAGIASLLHPSGLAGILPLAAAAFAISFLWFNGTKASVFMGDTGSLALGSIFVAWAFASGNQLSSILLGGLFLGEAISVMIQVFVFKASGRRKRIFLMAPIHHHFEKLGWTEPKIVDRFFVVSILFVIAGALTMTWR